MPPTLEQPRTGVGSAAETARLLGSAYNPSTMGPVTPPPPVTPPTPASSTGNEATHTAPTTPPPTLEPVKSSNEQALDAQLVQDQRAATEAHDALTSVTNGTTPLSAGEQAQVDGLRQQFQTLIKQQELSNIGSKGLGNIRGYQTGAGEYDPTFQVKTIGSIITAGANKVADLNSKMASAVAELTQSFQDKKFDRIKSAYDVYQTASKERVATLQKVIDDTNAALEKARQDQQDNQDKIDSVLQTAIKNGADADTVNAIKGSSSVDGALVSAGQFLHSEADVLDAQYKKAQIAKVYSDISNDAANIKANSLAGTDPSQIVAYANEYAATGKIPTGLPKGSFGMVAQVAKELPKQKGQILSVSTGVSPTGDATLQTGLGSLYSAIDLAKDLKELDDKRWGGIVSGTLGKVFGSQDQQRYVDLRSQIVDLLSRARSGAALTPSEEARYGDMLPTRFSEKLGLGVDSSVRIDNFINTLTKDSSNKASSQGWAINGLSKVDVAGQEYTVGDIIANAKGEHGRINADGSITIVQ